MCGAFQGNEKCREGLVRRTAAADDRFPFDNCRPFYPGGQGFGALPDLFLGLADHGQGWNGVQVLEEQGAEGLLHGLQLQLIEAKGTEHRVAADSCDQLLLAGNVAGLGAAEEFVTGEGDDVDTGGDAVLHERFVDAIGLEIDERAGTQIFVDGDIQAGEFVQSWLGGEAGDVKVAGMDAQQERGFGGDGVGVIGNCGFVGGADFDELNASGAHDVGDAEAIADFNEFAAADDDIPAFGQGVEHEEDGGGVVIDGDGWRAGEPFEDGAAVTIALAAFAGGEVVFKVAVAFNGLEGSEWRPAEIGMQNDAGGVDDGLEAGLAESGEAGGCGHSRIERRHRTLDGVARGGDGLLGFGFQQAVGITGELFTESCEERLDRGKVAELHWLFSEHGEEAFDFFVAGAAAILADFERFDVFDFGGTILAVPLFGDGAGEGGDAERAAAFEPFAAGLGILGNFVDAAVDPGQPFIELGDMGVHAVDLFFVDAIDVDNDVRREGIGLLEVVGIVEKNGVFGEGRGAGNDVGNDDHVGGVLDEDAGVAVVGMIVVGAVGDDDVGFPFADGADDLAANIEGGDEFAVVVVENLILFDAEPFEGFLSFEVAAFGEGATAHFVMTGITVSDGQEFYDVTHLGEESGGSAHLDVAIVGVRADGEDAKFLLRREGEREGKEEDECFHCSAA